MTELVIPAPADAARIAAVINARSLALHGVSEETAEGVAQWFELPFLDAAADMRLAIGPDRVVEGYADVSRPETGRPKAMVDLRVRPGASEALTLLVDWAQVRAADRAGVGGSIQFFADRADRPLASLLEQAGHVVVRSSYEMERALEGPIEPPVWPAGLVVRQLNLRDGETVHAAQDEAFADDWFYTPVSHDVWLANSRATGVDSGLSRVLWDGDEVAGVCLTHPRRGEDDSVGWIADLGVRRPWRRRGAAEALLREAFRAFGAAGKRAAGLGVDAENASGAVALYERVGLRVVRRSNTWERTV